MRPGLFSFPVLLTSWALALLAWVLVWWALPLAQGAAVQGVGGQFIGLSVPTWTQPWALVNEPSVGFAATRQAFWTYWLAPFLFAGLLALAARQLPAGDSLARHLFFIHLSFAAFALGFAWLPGLGLEDGLLAGLARFFSGKPGLLLWGAALLGGLGMGWAACSLASYLWWLPGQAKPMHKLLLWLSHLWVPAGLWVAWVALTSPAFPRKSLFTLAFAQALTGLQLGLRQPAHPLGRRHWQSQSLWLSWALVFLLAVPSFLAFAPRGGRPVGYLWGVEGPTSNLRRQVLPLPLKLPLVPAKPRGWSSPGS